jgi:uracil phosphoribosyltransferase
MGIHIVEHPILGEALARMRDAATPSAEFRAALGRAAAVLFLEASRDLPVDAGTVVTPLGTAPARRLRGGVVTLVPVLRAGMGFLGGILPLVPEARIAPLGIRRDEETAEPEDYYVNFPPSVAGSVAFVLDPMLATGGTLVKTLDMLEETGVAEARVLVLVASPEGVRSVREARPDLDLWTAAVDDGLDARKYIVPGLGDAGDRIFNTVG